MRALAVVDMQKQFQCGRLVKRRVQQRIRKAKAEGLLLLNVVLPDHGGLYEPVAQELQRTDFWTIQKHQQAGGLEIAEFLLSQGVFEALKSVEFCGIFADMCVRDTAVQFAGTAPHVDVSINVNAVEDSLERIGPGIREIVPKVGNARLPWVRRIRFVP